MIDNIIQYFFISVLLLALLFYGLIVYAARRAARQTAIPIPVLWQRIMIITPFFILMSIAFMLVVAP